MFYNVQNCIILKFLPPQLIPCIYFFIIFKIQGSNGHSHGVYPLIFLPGGLEPDTDDEDEESNAEQKDDVNLLINQMDLVITGSADATAKVWSLYSGECIHVSLLNYRHLAIQPVTT